MRRGKEAEAEAEAEVLRQTERLAGLRLSTGRPERGMSSRAQRRTANKHSSRARLKALEDKFGAAASAEKLRSTQLEGQLAAQLERTAVLEERTAHLESQLAVQLARNATLEETMTSRLTALERFFVPTGGGGSGGGADPVSPKGAGGAVDQQVQPSTPELVVEPSAPIGRPGRAREVAQAPVAASDGHQAQAQPGGRQPE